MRKLRHDLEEEQGEASLESWVSGVRVCVCASDGEGRRMILCIDKLDSGYLGIAVQPRRNKIQKHFQNVMLVEMASEISKNYTYKCVDRSRHNGIKGAKT